MKIRLVLMNGCWAQLFYVSPAAVSGWCRLLSLATLISVDNAEVLLRLKAHQSLRTRLVHQRKPKLN